VDAHDKYWNLYPYGCYFAADGREVLYNRGYKPIWQRHPDGPAELADPDEWVDGTEQIWFYGEQQKLRPPYRPDSQKTRAKCEAVLAEWGVPVRHEVTIITIKGGLPDKYWPEWRHYHWAPPAQVGKHTVEREFKERGAKGFERFKRRLEDFAILERKDMVIIGGLPE
jgi:hypothetical protein